MTHKQAQLNDFLVGVFNDILRLEDAALRSCCNNLSISEVHALEAVQRYGAAGMAEMATALGVTAGTLTIAIKTLEQKGYVVRTRSETDKRRVSAALTAQAQPVLAAHTAFHEKLVSHAAGQLDDTQLEVLCSALHSLHKHFTTL